MNVRDMHIEVNQSLQKVAANRTRKFLTPEIDWVLNKMVERYISSQLKPKSGGGFVMLNPDSGIRTLVTRQQRQAYVSDEGFTTILPADFGYLLADSSRVVRVCDQVANPVKTAAVINLTALTLGQTAKSTPMYYETVKVSVAGDIAQIPASLPIPNKYIGYNSKSDISFVVPFILSCLRRLGHDVYWERFGNLVYKPGQFIIRETAGTYASIQKDGGLYEQGTALDPLAAWTYGLAGQPVANRLTSSVLIPDLTQAGFYKSSALSPISELVGYELKTYADSSFIVTSTGLTYIRKPQNISLDLGTDCDLDPLVHPSICDLAVEYLKGRTDDQLGTQLAAQDLERRVTL